MLLLLLALLRASAASAARAGAHVVFLENAGAGHIHPTLPLVAALRAKGCAVTYFASADGRHEDECVRADTALGRAVLAAGAELRAYDVDDGLRYGEERVAGYLHAWWHRHSYI